VWPIRGGHINTTSTINTVSDETKCYAYPVFFSDYISEIVEYLCGTGHRTKKGGICRENTTLGNQLLVDLFFVDHSEMFLLMRIIPARNEFNILNEHIIPTYGIGDKGLTVVLINDKYYGGIELLEARVSSTLEVAPFG